MPLDGIKDINGIVRNGVKKQFRFVEMPHEESDISWLKQKGGLQPPFFVV